MSDWIKNAKPGQQIVCIDADGSCGTLEERRIYTISDVVETYGCGTSRNISQWTDIDVRLIETSPPVDLDGFHPRRFRPLQPRQTDISALTALLNFAPAPIEEDA
jgi:hypothetical protein